MSRHVQSSNILSGYSSGLARNFKGELCTFRYKHEVWHTDSTELPIQAFSDILPSRNYVGFHRNHNLVKFIKNLMNSIH